MSMKKALGTVLAFCSLSLTACGGEKNGGEIGAGGASIKVDAKTEITITLDGQDYTYGYLGNCTISPMMSGVMAWEEAPDFDSNDILPMLRVNAITQEGATMAKIEASQGIYRYAYEGPLTLNDRTMSWSGTFRKFERTYTPPEPATPDKEVGSVEGNGSISC